MSRAEACAKADQQRSDRSVAHGCLAMVPALGRPERDTRVVVRPIAGRRITRAIFVATRASDRARPSTAAAVAALARSRSPT
jgi:hypothetical protein